MSNSHIDEISKSLSQIELDVLQKLLEKGDKKEVMKSSGKTDVDVNRGLTGLASKSLVNLTDEIINNVVLAQNGIKSSQNGLAENKVLSFLSKHKEFSYFQFTSIPDFDDKGALPRILGDLKKHEVITSEKGPTGEVVFKLISKNLVNFEQDISKKEKLLKKIGKGMKVNDLSAEEKEVLEQLKRMKDCVNIIQDKNLHYELTDMGREIKKKTTHSKSDQSVKQIGKLTPEILANGSWKNSEFRPYDINAVVPKRARGKRHFLNQARNSAKRIWLDMGFVEMTGNMVQTSFWNFDALFTAQDHPVREMQDTFFIKNPKNGKLPDKKVVEKVKAAHENGGDTGSTGWQYIWDEDDSKQNVLRTHTTVLSAKTLVKIRDEKIPLPAKYFALGKCFRNETLDWSHLFEFNQTEGIVIDKDANFCNLLGYLKIFFKKMGYEKARFRPAYFPYTEFSVEVDVYHPVHKKWLELGGAGIFRPEVVKPLLGIDVPVLAWGPGFDRIIIDYFKITDIRDLYRNDLKQLREMKEWLR